MICFHRKHLKALLIVIVIGIVIEFYLGTLLKLPRHLTMMYYRNESRRATTSRLPQRQPFKDVREWLLHSGSQKQPTASFFTQKELQDVDDLLQPNKYPSVNCSKLFNGDRTEIEKAEKVNRSTPYVTVPLLSVLKATKNCDLFRKARGYVTRISKEEQDFPIAFSLLIHKNIEQFERLLRAIYTPSNYYCVHVDKKADKLYHAAVKSIADCFENVFIASKLEVVVYAGFTRLQAEINCMKELRVKYKDWKYFHNLAGTEMPLKPNRHTVQLLKLYNGTNLVAKDMHTRNARRWKKQHFTVVNGLHGELIATSSANIPAPYNLNMTKGFAYNILSRSMVEYIMDDPLPKTFLEWNKFTRTPDEHFWATLNDLERNPALATPGGNYCHGYSYMQRWVLWNSGHCHGRNVRKVCVFGVRDLPEIKSRHELAINKFDVTIDPIAYHCIEELLKDRDKDVVPWDIGFYQEYVKSHSEKVCKKRNA